MASILLSITAQKSTIDQVTTMLAASKNVLFPGPKYLVTTGADDPTFWLSPECHLLDSGFLPQCIEKNCLKYSLITYHIYCI